MDFSPTAVFVIFFSQVYVKVNKEAEQNEEMKQAARDFFRQLEQRESEAVSLWKQFREITVDEYQHIYKVQPAGQSNSTTPESIPSLYSAVWGQKTISE